MPRWTEKNWKFKNKHLCTYYCAEVFYMSYQGKTTLEDVLNNDARAYQYYYDLPPRVQTLLQMKDINSFAQLQQEVAEMEQKRRPDVV